MPISETSYYRIEARDSAGKIQEFYVAYRNQEFVLFQMDGGLANVMFLLKATSPSAIPQIITNRLIDVTDSRELPERPAITAVALGRSQEFTPMERAVVGVILETRDVS